MTTNKHLFLDFSYAVSMMEHYMKQPELDENGKFNLYYRIGMATQCLRLLGDNAHKLSRSDYEQYMTDYRKYCDIKEQLKW